MPTFPYTPHLRRIKKLRDATPNARSTAEHGGSQPVKHHDWCLMTCQRLTSHNEFTETNHQYPADTEVTDSHVDLGLLSQRQVCVKFVSILSETSAVPYFLCLGPARSGPPDSSALSVELPSFHQLFKSNTPPNLRARLLPACTSLLVSRHRE